MIKGISITNFKGIGDRGVTLDLKPITMLFGSNSAGKSTIFHAILYAYEVLVKHNLDADKTYLGADCVDLGGFLNFVHRHEPDRKVSIEFDLDLRSKSLDKEWPMDELLLGSKEEFDVSTVGDDVWSAKVKFAVAWNTQTNSPYVQEYSVELNDEVVGSIVCNEPNDPEPKLVTLNLYHSLFNFRSNEEWPFASSVGVMDELCPAIKSTREDTFFREGEMLGDNDDEDKTFDPILVKGEERPEMDFLDVRTVRRVHANGRFYDAVLYRCPETIFLWCMQFPRSEGWDEENEADRHIFAELLGGWMDELDHPSTPDLRLHDQIDALPDWNTELDLTIQSSISEIEHEVPDEFGDAFVALLTRLLVIPGRLLRDEIERCRYIGPLRETPRRGSQPPKTRDASRWASGLAAWDTLARHNDKFVERVSKWLADEDGLGTNYIVERTKYKEVDVDSFLGRWLNDDSTIDDLSLASEMFKDLPDQSRIAFRDELSGVAVDPRDIAIGITQLIPVLVAALDRHDGVSLMEQPELHNHPSVEVGLGDLFIQSISRGVRKTESCRHILETHGEHMALRILRRIRETAEGELDDERAQLRPEEVAIYHIARTEEGVAVKRLRIDETGEFIDKWPGGFFRERAEELF